MGLCDFTLKQDIQGYDCATPAAKGASSEGLLINRDDILAVTPTTANLNFITTIALKCGGKRAWRITQSGKTPFAGTQQEMVEGVYVNTVTNTLQLVVLKHDGDTAKQLHALINGEFVAIIPDKQGNRQVYGTQTGLHCTGAVRELYNDDTLSGWLVTMTEEGARLPFLNITQVVYNGLLTPTAECE